MSSKLQVEIGADASQLSGELKKGEAALSSFARSAAVTGGASLNSLSKGSDQAAFALTNLGRVAQDAPYGFIGIQNNLNPLLESFQALKAQTGSTGSALKALGQSLIGPAGIGIALSVVSAGILLYQKYAQSAKKETEGLAGSISILGKAYESGPYKEASKDINSLTINIGLAKKGFIDKKGVVDQYNETVGKTMGSVKTFSEVEKKLTEGGPAYIKMMLMKAAANLALEKAAESAFQAEQARLKKLSEFGEALDGTQNVNIRSAEDAKTRQKQIDRARQERKNQEIKAAEDAKKDLEQIANKFQTDAAELAKKFNFNFFDDNKGKGKGSGKEAVKKALPKKEDIQAAANEFAANVSISLIEASARETLRAENELKEQWAGIAADLDQNAPEIDALIIKPVDMSEMANAKQAFIDFNEELSTILNDGLINTLAGVGEAIGDALGSGANVIDSVGLSLLQSLGGVLSQLGQMAIATGIGIEAIKTSLKTLNPAVAVAAGVGLLALAGVVKAKAAKLGDSMGAGGGSSGVGSMPMPTGRFTTPSGSNYSSSGGGSGPGNYTFRIHGRDLVAILNKEGYAISAYKI